MFQGLPLKYSGIIFSKSFLHFFSTKKQVLPSETIIKPLWKNIYKRLQVFEEEKIKLETRLNENNDSLGSRSKEALRIRINEIEPIVSLHDKYKHVFTGISELNEMGKENPDKETKEFIHEESNNYKKLLEELEEKAIEFLIPKDRFDDCTSINIEIRPGVGGAESSLFAESLFNMYQNFFLTQGWRYKVTAFSKDLSIGKGCKSGQIKISGLDAYKKMKCESGIHKVIRVPETERYGRLHSSAVSVVVLPEIPLDFKIDEKDLKFEFMRASGAGGQHVNKTDSACRVTHIPTGIAVHNQEDRSQDKNKKNAVDILTNKLFLMEVEKANTFISSQRKEQIATADRSDKIRTYNFPQSRITDHRTNLTLFGIEKMLNGDFLEEFINEFMRQTHNEKLKWFLEDLNEGK